VMLRDQGPRQRVTGKWRDLYRRFYGSSVPVADMQVLVELDHNTWFAVVLPVGITTVATAIAILLAALVATGVVLWHWAPTALIGGDDGWSLSNVSRHILAIISSRDGFASLSQFQIMLWTLVVGGGAVYVMTLSGNLISISAGTLT
jgi:hypothetical protein